MNICLTFASYRMQHIRNCKLAIRKNKNKFKQPMNCSMSEAMTPVSDLLTPNGAAQNVFSIKPYLL